MYSLLVTPFLAQEAGVLISVWVGLYVISVLVLAPLLCMVALWRGWVLRQTQWEQDDSQARKRTALAYSGPVLALMIAPLWQTKNIYDALAVILCHVVVVWIVVESLRVHAPWPPKRHAPPPILFHQWLQALDDAHDALWPRVRPAVSRIVSLLLPVLVGLCIIDGVWQPWDIVRPRLRSNWDAVAGFMRESHNASEASHNATEASRNATEASHNATEASRNATEKLKVDMDITTPNTQISHNLGLTIAGFLGLCLAFWRMRRYSQETKVKEEGHITDRFIQASKQLGSEHITVRVAAINSLWRIAVDSPKQDDKRAVLDVLCAFIRSYQPPVKSTPGKGKAPLYGPADVQTALTYMGTRLQELQFRQDKCGYVFDLHGAQLAKSDWTGFKMSHVNLRGADLRKAKFSGAALRGADLSSVDLSEARLGEANLSGANLSSADLSGANLSETVLNSADLSSADLSGAKLTRADLSNAVLSSADLKEAVLSGANLSGAKLTRADLRSANLSAAKLTRADLRGTDLSAAKLTRAVLSSADLSSADLSSADLSSADLSSADLSSADLSSANLSGAVLNSADLLMADLSGAELWLATFIGTNISGADFTDAENLGQDQLDLACWDGVDPPTLPPGMRCPANYCRWDPDTQQVVSIETPAVIAPCPKELEDEDSA
ncbi:pentapeptide repeat-containing protein [Megalodesulfovibrio gigas]|nr:pentapeptide repeat-containing protein [Megalodesulfovibrio gigas]